jgi:DNA primase
MIPDDIIDEIRRRVDIVAVIGMHVQLRKAGHNFKGLCPFHNENTPSFNVNADKGFFYCFGCQKKGDAFSFVMDYEGKSFVGTANVLPERVGIAIPERPLSPAERRQRSDKSKLYELNKMAARFFRDRLVHPDAGKRARAYLAERGIEAPTSERFGLGYAPDSWDELVKYLASRGLPPELSARAGLIKERRSGAAGYYDAFRDRLVCPVILPGGEVCGFSARILGDGDRDSAKYINSPETPVYKKSALLYGIHRARDCFRRARRGILVEGNFDVIALHQLGLDETVAPLGTALTDLQIEQLRRQCEEVVLAYDGDSPGRAAALKALKALVAAGVAARVASLPAGQDPDSLARTDPNALRAAIDRAQPGVEFFIHEIWSRTERSTDARAAAVEAATELIGTVADPTQRDLLVGTLATAMDTDVAVIRRALARRTARGTAQPPEIAGRSNPSAAAPVPSVELEIIALLADHPKLIEIAEELEVFSLLTDGRLRDMYSAAREGRPILSALPEDADPRLVQHVLAGAYSSLRDPANTFEQAIRQLRRQQQMELLAQLQKRAVEAGRRGEVDTQRELLKEIVTLRRRSISNGETP